MKMHSRVNHPQYSNNKGWLIASILTSSLLTACGSGGSDVALDSTGSTTTALASTNTNTTETAAQAVVDQAAAAQAAAAQAAAAQAAAAQAAADQAAAAQAAAAQAAAAQAAAAQAAAAQAAAAQAAAAQAAADQAAAAQAAAAQAAADQAAAIAGIPAISTTAETVSGRYIKLDNAGKALPAAATSWACVKDKNTGLIWEEKTNDGGLRDKDWRYRHYHNYAGYGNTVDYNGVQLCAVLGTCDSYTYRDTVNSEGFCGRKGVWRLPLRAELGSIAQINDGDKTPHINQSIFPETANIYAKSAYCAENMASTAADCGYAAGTELHYTDDGRIECNYQGVDYTQPLLGRTTAMLEQSILVPLRLHGGEVEDGLPIYPQANWVCYTRLVSDN